MGAVFEVGNWFSGGGGGVVGDCFMRRMADRRQAEPEACSQAEVISRTGRRVLKAEVIHKAAKSANSQSCLPRSHNAPLPRTSESVMDSREGITLNLLSPSNSVKRLFFGIRHLTQTF